MSPWLSLSRLRSSSLAVNDIGGGEVVAVWCLVSPIGPRDGLGRGRGRGGGASATRFGGRARGWGFGPGRPVTNFRFEYIHRGRESGVHPFEVRILTSPESFYLRLYWNVIARCQVSCVPYCSICIPYTSQYTSSLFCLFKGVPNSWESGFPNLEFELLCAYFLADGSFLRGTGRGCV